MQSLQSYFSAVCGPKFIKFCTHVIDTRPNLGYFVLKVFFCLSASRFISNIFALKLRWPHFCSFGATHFRGGSLKFCTRIFKSGSLPNMWQNLVEFCSSEGGVLKKERKKKNIMAFHVLYLWVAIITHNTYV